MLSEGDVLFGLAVALRRGDPASPSGMQEQQQPLSRVERVRSSSTYPVGAVDIDPDSRRQVNRGYVAISRPVQHRRCPVGRRPCLHGRVRVCAVVWERDMMLSCYAICTC